jgi:ferritin-like metal-binding protein YciE
MSRLSTLQVLLTHELKDLYNAENQLLKALPKMAKAATDPSLQKAFNTHLEETQVHVERLEEIAKLLEITPKGKVCKAMEGLVEEGAQTIEDTGDASVKDLALIIAAQKVEHYEIAGYGSVRTLAETLGLNDIAEILQTTLDEEGTTDQILTDLAASIMPDAPEEEGDGE